MRKRQARAQVLAAVRAGGYGRREIVVRVNALGTPWGRDDLAAATEAGADAVLLPKVESAETVAATIAALGPAPGGVVHAGDAARNPECRVDRRRQPARRRAGHGYLRPDQGSPRARHPASACRC